MTPGPAVGSVGIPVLNHLVLSQFRFGPGFIRFVDLVPRLPTFQCAGGGEQKSDRQPHREDGAHDVVPPPISGGFPDQHQKADDEKNQDSNDDKIHDRSELTLKWRAIGAVEICSERDSPEQTRGLKSPFWIVSWAVCSVKHLSDFPGSNSGSSSATPPHKSALGPLRPEQPERACHASIQRIAVNRRSCEDRRRKSPKSIPMELAVRPMPVVVSVLDPSFPTVAVNTSKSTRYTLLFSLLATALGLVPGCHSRPFYRKQADQEAYALMAPKRPTSPDRRRYL